MTNVTTVAKRTKYIVFTTISVILTPMIINNIRLYNMNRIFTLTYKLLYTAWPSDLKCRSDNKGTQSESVDLFTFHVEG